MRAGAKLLLSVIAGAWLAGCVEEGQPSKARESTTGSVLREQQQEMERDRIRQESQRAIPPTVR